MLDQLRPFPGSLKARASVVLRPGVPTMPPGTERYRVPGGGSVVVSVEAGDEITLTDIEGQQACEILHADASGRIDPLALGVKASNDAQGLKSVLSRSTESAERTLRALHRRNIDLGLARAVRFFGSFSRPGETASFRVARDGVLVVAAPGGEMDPAEQDTATPIELVIRRRGTARGVREFLPEPLRDPLQDLRIQASTAQAYLVKAGEYIQVIDVAGRQMLRFPGFRGAQARQGQGSGARCDGDAHAHRAQLSDARPTVKSLRPRVRAAGRDRAGYVRPP